MTDQELANPKTEVKAVLSPEGRALFDFCQEGIEWLTGKKVIRTSNLAHQMLQAFNGDVGAMQDHFIKCWWGIKRDYDKLDKDGKLKWDVCSYDSRCEMMIESARRKLLVGSCYGYYYIIPYNTFDNYTPIGGELTLSITQHGIIETLITNKIIISKKDFPVWDVYEGDIVEIDRTDPTKDRLAKFVQNPFMGGEFLGCLSQVVFPDGTVRIYTKPKAYFDESMKRSKGIEKYNKETKKKELNENSPWVSFYLEMCHKTMRKGIVNEFAQQSPEVAAVVDYDNKTQFEDRHDVEPPKIDRQGKFARIGNKWKKAKEEAVNDPEMTIGLPDITPPDIDGFKPVTDEEMQEQAPNPVPADELKGIQEKCKELGGEAETGGSGWQM